MEELIAYSAFTFIGWWWVIWATFITVSDADSLPPVQRLQLKNAYALYWAKLVAFTLVMLWGSAWWGGAL